MAATRSGSAGRKKSTAPRTLADYALKLGQAAGGSISDGSAAIAGGRIMAQLEDR